MSIATAATNKVTEYDEVLVIRGLEILGTIDTAVRAKSKGDPLDCAVKNVARNNPCHVGLNTILDKMGGVGNVEGRQAVLEFLMERLYAQ